ncbi:DNA-binding TFAR19-related protein [Pyrolobus fumarii 1A]|uniref:DNA-binding protein Pyrfu_0088 n=1 Tax=Pyrolobus fumarii (strain DSM 11204 / 1A) TaxID=694429 RepID=G0EE44_PYRF1|nr:DNA-binding protein [Pyrolobus fumarii]AEM37960.1 DNA-binding TFAR19-related protein [Pyrolobus fumarii 1A]
MTAEYFDSELEELLRRKQQELARRLEEQKRREAELQAEAQRQALLRRILTSRARERLANVRLVRPELAKVVEDQIIALVQMGRLQPPVDEDVVKELLEAVYEQTRYEPRIRIKRK